MDYITLMYTMMRIASLSLYYGFRGMVVDLPYMSMRQDTYIYYIPLGHTHSIRASYRSSRVN